MKTKFMKVLSVLLAMALLATTGIGALAVYEEAVPGDLVEMADITAVDAGKSVSVSIVAKEDLILNAFEGQWGWSEGLSFTGMTSTVMALPETAGALDGNYWTAEGKLSWVDATFPETVTAKGTTVLTATFATNEELKAGNYRVTFQLEVLGDDMTLFDGEYTLEWSVHVHNDLDNDHMCDADNCDEKLSEHDFSNGDCPCGEKKPGLKGDIDLDGTVGTLEDVTMLARHYMNYELILNTQSLSNGDIDEDGDIDLEDLTFLARYYMGYDETLGGQN